MEKTMAPRRWMSLCLMTTLCAVALLGCRDDDPIDGDDVGVEDVDPNADVAPDDDADAGPPFDYSAHDPYELVPVQPGVDAVNGDASAEFEIPGPGEVRVGRIVSDTGFEGVWSHCRIGDFLMVNSEIRVCIQSETTNRYETFTGGKFVDARRHGQNPEDVLDMVKPLFDFGTATAESVEVVRDGSDGVAVLRVTGKDTDLAHLAGVLGRTLIPERNVEIITEYRLEPGSVSVELVSQFRAPLGRAFDLAVGDWFAYGDRARAWTPGSGFGLANVPMPWIGAMGEGHSFGLVFEETASPLGVASSQGIPWAEMRIVQADIRAATPAVIRRWITIGDGTLDSLRSEAAALRGEAFAAEAVAVQVRTDGGSAVAGAEVLIREEGTPITVGITDDEGNLTLYLEEGEYTATISAFAGPLMVERSMTVGSGEVVLNLPETAGLGMSVTDEDTGEPISSRVRFSHPDLGTWSEYALKGSLQTRLPVGEVTVVVTRGLEYDLHSSTINLAGDDVASLGVTLKRDVITDGWRSGDFHQHMEPSIDSRVSVYTRVMENVTQGLDLAVATDHEVVTDMGPAIEALGLSDELSTFPGVEISPVYAHYNLYPVPYRPDLRGRGSIELAYRDAGEVTVRRMPEIISLARAFETDPIVQMNHPRNSSGMLNHVSFDPELGPDAVTHADFTIDIDTIEVINRLGDVCKVLADWSGLLNTGHRITGLGNSDTHGRDGEAGTPRNYMRMDRDSGDIDGDIVRTVLRAGQVTVGTHSFIEFTDGTLPGDEVQVSDGSVTFDVRVTSPSWAQAEQLHVIVNGTVVETINRTGNPASNVDFDESITVDVDEDSWVLFWASGPQPSAPIPVARPQIAFTNPVFLRTGAGDWTAPGPQPIDVSPINTGYCSN